MKPPLSKTSPDDFQTPPETIVPLLPYMPKTWRIWECAAGEGNLVKAFITHGYDVIDTDILTGQDFRIMEPLDWDCVITNPPYSLKQQFLERAYQLKKPFAFLLPLTALETAKRQRLYQKFGLQLILFDRRIDFATPNKVVNSKSWFGTAWFTNRLNLPQQLNFVKLPRRSP